MKEKNQKIVTNIFLYAITLRERNSANSIVNHFPCFYENKYLKSYFLKKIPRNGKQLIKNSKISTILEKKYIKYKLT